MGKYECLNKIKIFSVLLILSFLFLYSCSNSSTSLFDTAVDGSTAQLKALLDKDANVNAKDERGYTALILASMSGNAANVKVLLNAGADIEAKDGFIGYTSLMYAALEGHSLIVDLLIKSGADVNVLPSGGSLDEANEIALPALNMAIHAQNAKCVKILLKAGAELYTYKNGFNTLIDACLFGNSEIVQAIVDQGVDVNEETVRGQTALMASLKSMNDSEDINSQDKDSMDRDALEKVNILLGNGAEVNAKDNNGNTSLMRAAKGGNVEVVKSLLAKGADVDMKDNEKKTSLMYAMELDDLEMITLLTNAGATE